MSNRPSFLFGLTPVRELDLSQDLQLNESTMQVYVPLSRLDYYRMKSLSGYEIFLFTAGKPVNQNFMVLNFTPGPIVLEMTTLLR